MSDEAKRLSDRYEEEVTMRLDILRIQHAEAMVLHDTFAARNERITARDEADIKDHLSVVRHRDEVIAAIDRQTAIMERIAAALERK